MTKPKFTISMAQPTLDIVDSLIDGVRIRSRSQSIEALITQALGVQQVKDLAILIKGTDIAVLKTVVDGKSLLSHHISWAESAGISRIFILTTKNTILQQILATTPTKVAIEIIAQDKAEGNISALNAIRDQLGSNFVVIHGDTYNHFNLKKMLLFHLKTERTATTGLISSKTPEKYGSVELEGDRIVQFNYKKPTTSSIIDAGVYIFKKSIFKYFTLSAKVFERDVLPKLTRHNEVHGYFTHGKYIHLGKEAEES